MPCFLAVDAGGTKTEYVLGDETRVLARVQSGSIKRLRVSAETATAELEQALEKLSAATSLPLQSIARTCIGASGNSVPLVADWLRKAFGSRVGGELLLVNDVSIGLDAAFRSEPGVLVIGGTGSNVAGRDVQGRLYGAGGWGPALADQGSGHRIGSQALRAIFLAKDEGRTTPLYDDVLAFWDLISQPDPEAALIELANSTPSPDVAQLAPLVVRRALEGDAVCAAMLAQEGKELGYLVRLVLRRMQEAAPDAKLPPIAFVGSIMEHAAPVRSALLDEVRSEFPAAHALDGVVDPVMGALWRARREMTE